MRKNIICLICAAVIAFSGFLTGCSEASSQKDSDRLSIVTTCFPPYDFARAVTGDSADITMLLCPGAEAHSYEPTPLDILKIQQCDVFIYVGGEGEVWAEEILEATDTSDMTVIRLFDFALPLTEEEVKGASPNGHSHHEHEEEAESHEEGGEEAHDHEHSDGEYMGYDEHLWTSPSNARLCVEGIRDALCEAVPEHISFDWKSYYNINAESYIAQLESLDRDFAEMTENAPSDVLVIGDRFPFRYLANDYDLEYFAAFSGCSSETEPGVYTMAFLIDEILAHDIDTVFCLEFSTARLAQKLCDATGAEMLTLHSCNNVSSADFENGITYIDLMRQNLANIKEALY